jgi:hypothetical protein
VRDSVRLGLLCITVLRNEAWALPIAKERWCLLTTDIGSDKSTSHINISASIQTLSDCSWTALRRCTYLPTYRKQRNFVHNGTLYLFQKFMYICYRTLQIKVGLKPDPMPGFVSFAGLQQGILSVNVDLLSSST